MTSAPIVFRDACPVCGSGEQDELYREPYVGGAAGGYVVALYGLEERRLLERFSTLLDGVDFAVMRCRNCGALWQEAAPVDAFAAEIYGAWIDGTEMSRTEMPFAEFTYHIQHAMILTDFLLRQTEKASPADLRILDYGAGMMRFARAMRACGCVVDVYDASPTRQEIARAEGFRQVSADRLDAEGYDFINTEQVLEHLPSPGKTFGWFARALKPSGVVKVSVPLARWIDAGDFRIKWQVGRYDRYAPTPVQPLEHLTYFTPASLGRLAARNGLTTVRLNPLREINFAFDWRTGRQVARNLARPFIRGRIRNFHLFANPHPGGG